MRKLYEVSEAAEVKLLSSYMSADYDELADKEETLSRANLQPRQFVVIVEKEGAVWPDPDKYKNNAASSFIAQTPASDCRLPTPSTYTPLSSSSTFK